MKTRTNLKSGISIDTSTATSYMSDQASGFYNTAEQQAAGLSNKVANTLNTQKQGFSNLLGLT